MRFCSPPSNADVMYISRCSVTQMYQSNVDVKQRIDSVTETKGKTEARTRVLHECTEGCSINLTAM